ncbi:MAG TPA: SRPBCC domain-containing protein [Labilithrix sp.]|nr:SRPBCC domain-containing protein [Labilithrix sp.]
MSFVAQAELTIDAPPQRVFDRLADFAAWPSWMPPSFVPLVKPGAPSPLRLGDRIRVKVGGAPFASTLRLSALERPREIAWRGGLRGILWAEHRFVLEPDGERRTRVRSIETWHGALAGLTRRIVKPLAEKIGGQQLAGLARASALTN